MIALDRAARDALCDDVAPISWVNWLRYAIGTAGDGEWRDARFVLCHELIPLLAWCWEYLPGRRLVRSIRYMRRQGLSWRGVLHHQRIYYRMMGHLYGQLLYVPLARAYHGMTGARLDYDGLYRPNWLPGTVVGLTLWMLLAAHALAAR